MSNEIYLLLIYLIWETCKASLGVFYYYHFIFSQVKFKIKICRGPENRVSPNLATFKFLDMVYISANRIQIPAYHAKNFLPRV